MQITKAIRNFLKEEDGVTMIEYALMAALVAVALITTLKDVEASLDKIFKFIKEALDKATVPGGK